MRKLALGLGIAFFCFCCSNVTLASSSENENLNARIKALQERLKEFQKREYKDQEEKMIAEEEAIDLILDKDESLLPLPEIIINDEIAEQIVEDFENRSDVAMTVLFHDNELDDKFETTKSFFAMIDPPKVIIEGSNLTNHFNINVNNNENNNIAFNVENHSEISFATNTEKKVENKIENKQEFYEQLRQKVLHATRSNKLDNDERQQLLASLN